MDTSGGSNSLSELKQDSSIKPSFTTEVVGLPELDLVQSSQYQYDGSGEHSQDIQPLKPGHTRQHREESAQRHTHE